ncbi:hypothetical protein LINPERPRIM_LOCUS17450 [Linum perenne]
MIIYIIIVISFFYFHIRFYRGIIFSHPTKLHSRLSTCILHRPILHHWIRRRCRADSPAPLPLLLSRPLYAAAVVIDRLTCSSRCRPPILSI